MSDIVFNQVMLREDGFSIRAGTFSFFITHDVCGATVYTLKPNRTPYQQGPCTKCNKAYPEKMEGLITLLDWQNEKDVREGSYNEPTK